MPTLRKDRGKGWWARVFIDGKQVASKMFPAGKKGGSEWRAAKTWEEESRQAILQYLPIVSDLANTQNMTPSGLELFLMWVESYLIHAKRTMKHQTLIEKETILKAFCMFCKAEGIENLEAISKGKVYMFLADVADQRSPNRANVYRKNLLAAWNWGIGYVDGFPHKAWVIESIPPFNVEAGQRYVPPEEDVIKVLRLAQGQDLVMLLTYYFTGGRKSELFRLAWDTDIRLDTGRMRLTDYKGKHGKQRVRWHAMHPELVKAFAWWWHARPCKVNNVFMQTHCDNSMGLPFTQRRWFMPRLCEQAGIKPFGFHGLRHKAAAITFEHGGIAAAQILMGHDRATTTDRYVKSVGLYTDQSAIVEALASSGIGQEGIRLLQIEKPHEVVTHEAFCIQKYVHDVLQ